ncbi:hypothetical protein LEP1GSC035_1101 [Leptospira noguchii str. 2007001578]|uniref:Uncharacterized protein n=1 Tax=Leptospira noguchii str. 2007001578 TaxID=1049974 RepID=A0ABP2T595_9LEPT|nr:hypothetical protein LEP1GSC035_1101 [Leptospira noguchii str. 2007001578]
MFCDKINGTQFIEISNMDRTNPIRQNGALGLEKRGLDASIYHKTRKPTEGTQ